MIMPYLILGGAVLAAIILVIFIITRFYKVASPDTAMVVTGPRKSETVIGKGRFVIPIIQKVSYMFLENISCDFTSRDKIHTNDVINILIDAVANVAM